MKPWGDIAHDAFCSHLAAVPDRWHQVALDVIAEYEARGRQLSDHDRALVARIMKRKDEQP